MTGGKHDSMKRERPRTQTEPRPTEIACTPTSTVRRANGKHEQDGVCVSRAEWDPEEDQLILALLQQMGPKWSKIVQQLPGR